MNRLTVSFVGFVLLVFWINTTVWATEHSKKEEPKQDVEDIQLESMLGIRYEGMHHTHKAEEFMLGYHFSFMSMGGIRQGVRSIDTNQLLTSYMVAPLEMKMQMHMFHIMYGVSDWLTLSLMPMIMANEMSHINRMGAEFTTKSSGLGDLDLIGLVTLLADWDYELYFDMGFSVPTGSINAKDTTPAGPSQKLPYPMQLGSGSLDLKTGMTFVAKLSNFYYGTHVGGVFRLHENSNNYRLGHQGNASLWASYRFFDWLEPFAKLHYNIWGNIQGADPDLNPMMVPTADPQNQGGQYFSIETGIGTRLELGDHDVLGLILQASFPFYQFLEGPQPEKDWQVSVRLDWTHSFLEE
jgi:hypothetical protein